MKTIVQEGDPVLREKATAVPEKLFGSKELSLVIRDMAEALDQEPDGVALAAPQIGVSWRLFIVRKDRVRTPSARAKDPPEPQVEVYINPEFARRSRKKQETDEGCLSVRGYYGMTRRHERATLRARSADGTKFERGAGGLLAQIFEHEVDHLNGILFTDHATQVVKLAHPGTQTPFAFFGTPYVARDTLAHLIENGLVPRVVITNPDAPRGRGHILTPSETKTLAEERAIPVLTPDKLTPEVVADIVSYGCEYALVVAYGKILPESLIQAFPKGVLNVHYSLLPKYRGASPVESALLNGERVTGVSIQRMVKELDAGDVLASVETPIEPNETTRELRPRLVELGARLLIETLPSYLAGATLGTPQDHTQATRAPKIKKEEGELNLSSSDEANWRKYRAFAEGPGTYFFKNGKRMKITKAKYDPSADGGAFVVERIIPEGGREVPYA